MLLLELDGLAIWLDESGKRLKSYCIIFCSSQSSRDDFMTVFPQGPRFQLQHNCHSILVMPL